MESKYIKDLNEMRNILQAQTGKEAESLNLRKSTKLFIPETFKANLEMLRASISEDQKIQEYKLAKTIEEEKKKLKKQLIDQISQELKKNLTDSFSKNIEMSPQLISKMRKSDDIRIASLQ